MRVSVVLRCLFYLAATRAAVIRKHEGMTEELTPEVKPEPEAAAAGRARSDAQPRHRPREEPRDGLTGCLGCPPRSGTPDGRQEEELIQLYIEKIKQEILSQLGLSAPPNVTTNSVAENIPEPLKHDDEEAADFDDKVIPDDEDYDTSVHDTGPTNSQSRQIIVFGNEVEFRHRPQDMKHNFRFEFPSTLPVNDIASVDLWLHSTDNADHSNCTNTHSLNAAHTLSVHSPTGDGSSSRQPSSPPVGRWNLLASRQAPRHPGWFRVRLADSLEALTASSNATTDRELGVDHGDCVRLTTTTTTTEPSHRPFLALLTRRRHQRRRKRNAQRCQNGSNCCRAHSLYINFRTLGFNFIISPNGFETNYCRGSCSVPAIENLVNSRRVGLHPGLLQKVSLIQNSTEYLPCCAATSFSPLSLLYRNENNVAIQENIPNVKVNSCGCS